MNRSPANLLINRKNVAGENPALSQIFLAHDKEVVQKKDNSF